MLTIANTQDLFPILKTKLTRQPRCILALSGAPGCGKSTLADQLLAHCQEAGLIAAILPMDGYHLDNALLVARGLRANKGAPETFDLRGYAAMLYRLRHFNNIEALVPVFDRAADLSRNAARTIGPEVQVVITEGNYLRLDEPGWRDLGALFDITLQIDAPMDVLQARLVARWRSYGLDDAAALERAMRNDIPNAQRVEAHKLASDYYLLNDAPSL